jgi:hypothetical protein
MNVFGPKIEERSRSVVPGGSGAGPVASRAERGADREHGASAKGGERPGQVGSAIRSVRSVGGERGSEMLPLGAQFKGLNRGGTVRQPCLSKNSILSG